MLCSDILRNVSGKLQDEDPANRRWPWESSTGYSLIDSLNSAIREIVTQRPDATAITEPIKLGAGYRHSIPQKNVHLSSHNAVSLIDIIQNISDDGSTPGKPVFRVELDALRTSAKWGDTTDSRIENWAYAPLDNRSEFWVYPRIGKEFLWVEATYSAEPTVVVSSSDLFPLPDSFANAAYQWILFDVLAGDHSESNFGKAQAFFQAFSQSLGIKLQTDMSYPFRKGVNDAKA